MKTVFESFRIKSAEPLRLTTATQRRKLIREAGRNPFHVRAEGCADESYAGARSFFREREEGYAHMSRSRQGFGANDDLLY